MWVLKTRDFAEDSSEEFRNVKPEKISFFLKNGKKVIFVEIVQAKTWKFSRSRMTKQTSPLELSREI